MSWKLASEESHETLWLDPKRSVPMFFRWIVREGNPVMFRLGQRGQQSDEEPIHEVLLNQPYLPATFPVTQQQFELWTQSDDYRQSWLPAHRSMLDSFPGPHQNHFDGNSRHPAESLSWLEATGYCAWLNESGFVPGGFLAQLPSEARWEYGCRAGSITDYHTGDGEVALEGAGWYAGNSGHSTHEVGGKIFNGFHLYDMHGNVSEWCQDCYVPSAWRRRPNGVIDPVENSVAMEGEISVRGYRNGADLMGRILEQPWIQPSERKELADLLPKIRRLGPAWDFQVIETALETGEWPVEERQLAGEMQRRFQKMSKPHAVGGDQPRVLRGGSWLGQAAGCRSVGPDGSRPVVAIGVAASAFVCQR